MNKLTKEQFELAGQFLMNSGRALERALFEYEFGSGSQEAVLEALSAYQNDDGGFGHGLESDLRSPQSSALATTVGLQHLSGIGLDGGHEMVRRAIQYFIQTYDPVIAGWEIIPVTAAEAPRAIWWEYPAFTKEWGNPGAEITGYFHLYSDLVPNKLLDSVTSYAVDYLNTRCALDEMHEMLCFVRLADQLPVDTYNQIAVKLNEFMDNCVVMHAADRQPYGAYPLQIVDSPASRYFAKYSSVIPHDLDMLLTQQGEDGAWPVNWAWGRYDEEWQKAELELKGVMTLQALRTLRAFGRL
ncbi:hypothetical protein ACFPYJ_12040 [Paenibacillus solisilvae]|uniref:Prenyltransferase n=1 Tax=Paenibacillus solisilvae TaxID=2486751 RepID=A0ABW0VYK4_9BACL